MREMIRKPEVSVFCCSECSWTFPLTIRSELQDYLQERNASIDFARHSCDEIRAIQEDKKKGA
jgi:hypothetical protein